MKKLTLIAMTCFIVMSAQADFDPWNFVPVPAASLVNNSIENDPPKTKEKAIEVVTAILPAQIRDAIAPYWTVKLAKIALINERPHSDTATNALFLATIPADATIKNELRYFAAFQRELSLDYDKILANSINSVRLRRFSDPPVWQYATWSGPWVNFSHTRASDIVALMARLEGIPSLATLASNPDFVRDSIRVLERNEEDHRSWHPLPLLTGIEITSSTNPVSLKVGPITQRLTFPASTTLAMRQFHRLGNVGPATQINQTSGATIISQNGPNLITVGTTSAVLAKDSSRILSFQDLGQGVKSVPIDLPVATRTLPDITLEQAEVESVNLEGLFSGIRFTTAVTTSDSSKVTVAKSTSGSTMGVTAVLIGSAVVNVSATNEAGTSTVSFNVTVTAQSE